MVSSFSNVVSFLIIKHPVCCRNVVFVKSKKPAPAGTGFLSGALRRRLGLFNCNVTVCFYCFLIYLRDVKL